MELIDRYIYEVGRQLPQKSRADLEAEIRSLLEDMLEARSQKAGRPVDEDMVIEVLKEYGPPEKVAAAYLPERYLIGPQLYPGFMTVIKIAAPVIVALAILRFGITLGQGGLGLEEVIQVAAKRFLEMVSEVLQVLGNIVVIFAILQWALPNLKLKVKESDWDPRKLGDIPTTEQVKLTGQVFDIAITLAALAIFNFYPHIIAIGWPVKGQWNPIPVLNDMFFNRYLLVLNVVWILQIVLGFILLRQGRWQNLTYWFSAGIKVINIAVASAILAGPTILAVTPQMLVARGFPVQNTAELLVKLMDYGLRWVLITFIAASAFDLAKIIYRRVIKPVKPVVLVKA
jgi:hypothetical protein